MSKLEEMDVEFRKVMEEKESARWWRKGRQRLRRRAKRRSFRTVVKCSAQITSVFSPPQRVDFWCCQAFRKTIFGLNSCRPGFALLRAILRHCQISCHGTQIIVLLCLNSIKYFREKKQIIFVYWVLLQARNLNLNRTFSEVWEQGCWHEVILATGWGSFEPGE